MQHNEKYHTKSHIRRSNTQDKVFIAFIVLLMALIFGGLLSGCLTHDPMLRSKILEKHDYWPDNVVQKIENNEVEIGFSKAQVLAAKGRPIKINTTERADYKSEQWVYEHWYYENRTYYYFRNGTLTTIQK